MSIVLRACSCLFLALNLHRKIGVARRFLSHNVVALTEDSTPELLALLAMLFFKNEDVAVFSLRHIA